jgi:type IV pilus assembly protein PilC
MASEAPALLTFAYRAQMREGQSLTGTIDATDLADAQRRLQSLQLQAVQIESAPRPPRAKTLRGDDFFAFNQQLAQLTNAGMPVEQGLRLIAAELRHGSMKRTLEMVAADLESGQTLPQAIERRRAQFPPLYAHLVDAGIRAGNLPRILLNLGRHLTLVRRLQAMLWRTFSYPIVILATFVCIFCFLLLRVFPQFRAIFDSFHTQLPGITVVVMAISNAISDGGVFMVLGGLAAIVLLVFIVLWMLGRDRAVAERVLLPLPLIGPILRRNLISRWCDAVGIGVEAGMDLPAAIDMANDAIGSAALRADGQAIVSAISAGRPVSQSVAGRVLPAMVISGIDLASRRNDLPQGLATLADLYQQQAELRMNITEAVLTPVVVLLMGCAVATLVLAVFAPLIAMINAIQGPWH